MKGQKIVTDTNGTADNQRATVPQILAKLLLEQRERKLPDPQKAEASQTTGVVGVELSSLTVLKQWVKALGGKVAEIGTLDVSNCKKPFKSYRWRRYGWREGWILNVEFDEDVAPCTTLDDATVAALEEVASAPAEPVETRVSDERVQEIHDRLNGFIEVEYEGGTVVVDGAAVSNRVAVGADYNLDKAVDWAAEQIGPDSDIVNAFGPDVEGAAEVELVDGTVIEFASDRKRWAVCVCDDAKSGVSA